MRKNWVFHFICTFFISSIQASVETLKLDDVSMSSLQVLNDVKNVFSSNDHTEYVDILRKSSKNLGQIIFHSQTYDIAECLFYSRNKDREHMTAYEYLSDFKKQQKKPLFFKKTFTGDFRLELRNDVTFPPATLFYISLKLISEL